MELDELLEKLGLKTKNDFINLVNELGVIKEKNLNTSKIDEYLANNIDYANNLKKNYINEFLKTNFGEGVTPDRLVTKDRVDNYNLKFIEMELEKNLGENYSLLKPHINLKNVEIGDDFKINGLEEQVATLKTNFPNLFPTKEKMTGGGTGGDKGSNVLINPWKEKDWDEKKQVEMFQNNKEQAIQFMKETGYDY